jgi:hypothetical protein
MKNYWGKFIEGLKEFFDNAYVREQFAKSELSKLSLGQSVLDA